MKYFPEDKLTILTYILRILSSGLAPSLGTTQWYSEERKGEILRFYPERASLRGTQRVCGVAITAVLRWKGIGGTKRVC
ncbi:MAG: hypothetical protein KKF44_05065 [Nanoarchaeota archaeon]|nr:hypothetical protein [Nanoarchaeota archaeon]